MVDPEVVAFLADERLTLDPARPLSGSTFAGAPLTAEQRSLIIRATWPDLEAARDLRAAHAQALAESADALVDLLALTARYGAADDGITMTEARARMTPADQAEYDRLADVVAPSGYLLVPTEGEQ